MSTWDYSSQHFRQGGSRACLALGEAFPTATITQLGRWAVAVAGPGLAGQAVYGVFFGVLTCLAHFPLGCRFLVVILATSALVVIIVILDVALGNGSGHSFFLPAR